MSVSAPVLIAAGGTGGHIVPALAVADVLAERNVPVVWVGTRTGLEARLVPAAGIEIRWIDVAGLRGKGILGTLIGPFRLLRACLQSVYLLMQVRPQAILGMGGFVSGPVGLAAVLLRKPLVLHEQNAIAGMTNRWLARVASKVLAAWPGAFRNGRDVSTIGNPVRRKMSLMADGRRNAEVGQGDMDATTSAAPPLRVLVVGGSRGARVLNETLPEVVAQLACPLVVTHQTGDADESLVQSAYAAIRREGMPSRQIVVQAFIDDMAVAYQAADLVICRSGAMTVTELSALGVASILVPFPYAVDDHQNANARHLSDAGAAVRIVQSELTVERLVAEIDRLDRDRTALAAMATAARGCFQAGAAEAVADALMNASHGPSSTSDTTTESQR